MRKNTATVLQALAKGRGCHQCEAIHTDGNIVKSYNTIVAIPDVDDPNHWLVTEHGAHSVTTTVQTNGLQCGLEDMGKRVSRVPQSDIDTMGYRHP